MDEVHKSWPSGERAQQQGAQHTQLGAAGAAGAAQAADEGRAGWLAVEQLGGAHLLGERRGRIRISSAASAG